MKQFQARMRTAWAERQPRERRFLLVLVAFVAFALLVQGLWSAASERARLHKKIPQLRLQAETMQRQASEIRQLQAQATAIGAAAMEGASLLAAASTAAKTGGLGLAAAQLQLEGSRQVRLRATLPFDRWLDWIATVQRESRLRLIRCQIESTDGAGVVKIDALLALPEPA